MLKTFDGRFGSCIFFLACCHGQNMIGADESHHLSNNISSKLDSTVGHDVTRAAKYAYVTNQAPGRVLCLQIFDGV